MEMPLFLEGFSHTADSREMIPHVWLFICGELRLCALEEDARIKNMCLLVWGLTFYPLSGFLQIPENANNNDLVVFPAFHAFKNMVHTKCIPPPLPAHYNYMTDEKTEGGKKRYMTWHKDIPDMNPSSGLSSCFGSSAFFASLWGLCAFLMIPASIFHL